MQPEGYAFDDIFILKKRARSNSNRKVGKYRQQFPDWEFVFFIIIIINIKHIIILYINLLYIFLYSI